ncbi:MAG: isoprenyl transferase [Deltaproteobacteria bacterium]|nr:isoprenyl transferase [Deltaproteobacteria bacterium]
MNDLSRENLPRHIAVIMDGNGRWAKNRSMPRIHGHQVGMDSVRAVISTCARVGVEYLSLYAFSVQNWLRPETEVRALMLLLKTFIQKEIDNLHRANIRVTTMGEIDRLPRDAYSLAQKGLEKTRNNTGMVLNIAWSYGGREEIVRAAQEIALKAVRGELDPAAIDEQCFARHLYTADMPDPDLLIRTSGEMRISNFLLWQIAYTEMYVTDVLWPDFREEETLRAIAEYQTRKRRFGRTDEQLSVNA